MKKFILALIVILTVQLDAFSQTGYPKFETDSSGQQVVVLTIKQAQALDNNTDLLFLFEKLNSQISDYDSVCIKVISEKDKVIAFQDVQINTLKQSLVNKDNQISKLQEEVSIYLKMITSLNTEIANKDTLIKLHKDQVRKLKIRSAIGGTASGLAIIGLIILVIMK